MCKQPVRWRTDYASSEDAPDGIRTSFDVDGGVDAMAA
jgi:hypothetical protein